MKIGDKVTIAGTEFYIVTDRQGRITKREVKKFQRFY